MAVTKNRPRFPALHGGAPALDFVNTQDPRLGARVEEFLVAPEALTAWAEYAGIARGAVVSPAGLRRALRTREALYRTFVALAEGRAPSPVDLDAIHAAHVRAFSATPLARRDGALVYDGARAAGVDAILWPVLESTRAILADPSRLKLCPGDDCGWVFLDATRSGTRRWCSMASCGTREKMRRYRARDGSPRRRVT